MKASPSDPQSSSREESPAELEERLRQRREERVRKSLAALDRDRLVFGSAAGAQTLVRVIGIVLSLLGLWWVLARISS